MIVTQRFAYIHLHKSGGTFVNEVLLRFFPEARQLGYHLPRSLIPAEYRHLPVLGFVRNPWSYYVSWYSFQKGLPQPNALFRCLSENGTLDFKDTVRNMLDLGEPGSKLDSLLPLLSESYTDRGLNLPRRCLEPIRGSGLGFYSYLAQHMYAGEESSLFIGRTERLREDFLKFLRKAGVGVEPDLITFVAAAPARNASSHAAWPDYYDEDLCRHVALRDSAVIARFEYRFENLAAAQQKSGGDC